MKKISLILLAFNVAFNVMAYDFTAVSSTGQKLYYTIISVENKTVAVVPQNTTLNLIDYTSSSYNTYYDIAPSGALTIPEIVIYNGIDYSVIKIGDNAFHYTQLAGSLVLPNSITSIGNKAFEFCSNITGSLIIPNSVTSIGDSAFFYCRGFKGSLAIPGSVNHIGNGAFLNCNQTTAFNIESNNKMYSSIDGIIYNFLQDTIIACPSGKAGSLTIPSTVTTIGNKAFMFCYSLTGKLTIPNSVRSIGDDAFVNCGGFVGILTIPNSVKSIGNRAFSTCYKLTGILTIPNSVTFIGDKAFEGCYGFTGSIIIPTSVNYIGKGAFSGCSETAFSVEQGNIRYSSLDGLIYSILQDTIIACPSTKTGILTIPNSVTSIGDAAFSNCLSLTGDLKIPNSVTSIGNYAFYNCAAFTGSLTIPNSVTSIGDNAFGECSGFKGNLNMLGATSIGNNAFQDCTKFTGSLTIPSTVISIGDNAFYNCGGFTGTLTIPSSVTSIGRLAFYNCIGLTGNLTIPSSVKLIGYGAFDFCTGFTGNLTISNTITSIESRVFSNCYYLTGNITIPKSITTIGASAFYYCFNITGSLTIPNSVTYIGDGAFDRCLGITSIYTDAITPIKLGNIVFNGVNKSSCILYVPAGSKSAYQNTYQWQDFQNIVEMTTAVPSLLDAKVSLYPNPSTTSFQIKGIEGVYTIILSDLNGKTLLTKQVTGSENISVANLPKGMYIVKLATKEGTIERKIVKD